MSNLTAAIYKEKFHYVTFKSKDGIGYKQLTIGNSPLESLNNAKYNNLFCVKFKVGAYPYNSLGERLPK